MYIARSYIIWTWESYKLILVTLNVKKSKFQQWLIRKHSRPGIFRNKFRESENHEKLVQESGNYRKKFRESGIQTPPSPPPGEESWNRRLVTRRSYKLNLSMILSFISNLAIVTDHQIWIEWNTTCSFVPGSVSGLIVVLIVEIFGFLHIYSSRNCFPFCSLAVRFTDHR